MSRIIQKKEFNYNPKHDAFPYQTEAFIALKDLNYGAIFHEQGLGKTKIATDLMLYWLNKKDIDTVMIITKKQLVFNWQEELKTHSYLKSRVLSCDKGKNYTVLNSAAKIVVTNFETISTDKDRIKLFLMCRNVACIIDESTKIKNPNSKLTKDFFEISNLFKIRIIMTGTPVANRPYDIWSQIYFLDHGLSLGKDFNKFKNDTDLKNNFNEDNIKKDLFEENVSNIYNKISKFCVRETKNSCGLKLPNKEYIKVNAVFSKKQLSMYESIIKELSLEINKNGEMIVDDETESLKRLLRLNQVTSNPRLIDDSYTEKSGKEIELDNLIKSITAKNEKTIIWTSYIENVNYFCNKYKNYNAKKVHGNMNIEDRNKSIDSFKNDVTCKLLFATPQAAKEGLTLTVANNAIFYDRTFNLDDYLQAQDRIHRISQTKTCYIYNICIKQSIDEWIEALLNAKQCAAFLAQGDIGIDQYKDMADYNYGDIIKNILKEGNN